MIRAPIALFVYNRPSHIRLTVQALLANALADQTPLYLFSDAPRNEAAILAVAEVRSYIRSIAGFKSVTIIERETNFGLARSIIDGVTRLCEEYGHVIVMEDDLITSPHFLSYMNDALTRYEHEDRVMQIAGYMFPINLELGEDALFLPFTSSWGWATWRRAWRIFDAAGAGYQRLKQDQSLRRRFDLNGKYGYFKMLESQLRGETDSWAIRWYLSVFLMNGLTLYPKKTLVGNFGFDGSGVNCVASSIEGDTIERHFRVITMPKLMSVSDRYEVVLQRFPKARLNIKTMSNKMRHLFKSICSG
ncbi:MAG TPA: glycosyltransferase family 2 protein [Nitrosospira sp.]|nr:glycosyltransferase family 2 protein [Nitrosospira sp.]